MLRTLHLGLLRPFSVLAFAGAVCAATSAAWAAPASATADAPPPEVRAWLLRIHQAASHRNFQGTFVVSGGGAVSSARIAHFCEGPNQFERSEALDGQARHVYRHNDVVTTIWPTTHVATIEPRDPLAQFPSLLQAGDDRVADFYDVQPQGDERVAGRDANVLLVQPRDALRYGYRLWADRSSGLLLRADVIGADHAVLESSAFSDVAIGVRPQPESVLLPMKKLDGYRVLRPTLTPAKLETEGWSMHEPAPGFHQVSCFKRPMEGVLGSGDAPPGHRVLQTIFSDGLTYVSVFIEPYDPARHTRAMLASLGPTQTLMQQQGDWWVTIVGDVPPATLRLFAKALERSKK